MHKISLLLVTETVLLKLTRPSPKMLSGQYYMLYQTLCMFSHSSRTSSQMCEFPIPCALLHTLDFAGCCTVLKTSNTLSLLFSPEDHGIHHFPFFQTRSNPGQEKAAVDFAF